MSEDCLRLNVWSNGLGRNDKRPVMVGCMAADSPAAMALTIYDGTNLAKKRDVVAVTINTG
jgi:para-nitrobenzyl esterase